MFTLRESGCHVLENLALVLLGVVIGAPIGMAFLIALGIMARGAVANAQALESLNGVSRSDSLKEIDPGSDWGPGA